MGHPVAGGDRIVGALEACHRPYRAVFGVSRFVRALVVAALSTATIALLPYDTALRNWAQAHIGQWTPIVGQVTPVLGIRLGYVAGASAFANVRVRELTLAFAAP